MALPRHIYRSKKLSNIPQKRYSRKYNPDYLLEKASYGASIKQGFGDFDGDGDLDGMYPKQRAGVAEKPGLHINEPRRGPRNLISFGSPTYGPINLRVPTPESGPLSLEFSVDPPQLGPTSLNTTVQASSFGPASLNASILAPAAGPLNLSIARKPAAGPSSLGATTVAPTGGPSNILFLVPPAAGPLSLSGSVDYNVSLTIDSDTTYIKWGVTYSVDATVHGHYTYYPSSSNPYYLKSLNLNCTAYTGDEIKLLYYPERVGSDYVVPQKWSFSGTGMDDISDKFYYTWNGPIGTTRPVTSIVTGSKSYGTGPTC